MEPDEELLELAETLISKKSAPFDPNLFHDRYVDALKDLVARKLKAKGGKVTPEEEPARPSGANVIDLMAALKKSIEKPEGPAAAKASAKKPAARKSGADKAQAAPVKPGAKPRKRA